MCLRNRTWGDLEVIDDGCIELFVVEIDVNHAPGIGAGQCKAQLSGMRNQWIGTPNVRCRKLTCTATYAIERGVTLRKPINDAT
jgi:hypothetical protein